MNAFNFVLGVATGALIVATAARLSTTDNQTLHKVGIERIEKCHNVHSNWYEIVWKDGK